MLNRACLISLILFSGNCVAGYFDCSVVYDEFENLMNKRFLVEPDRFVATAPGGITKAQFETQQKGRFSVFPSRAHLGIGILTTNNNIHAKFLYHWSEPLADGSTHLIIDEVVRYGRVSDGYAPTRTGPFRLKSGAGLDIDSHVALFEPPTEETEEQTPIESESGAPDADTDLRYTEDLENEIRILEAVNGARVQFPLESLCHKVEN